MRTLHRYILFNFLALFGISLGVVTLVMYLGGVLQGLDYVARGVPASVLLKIFTLNIPYLLSFSIPMSTIVATLLLFGRLSIDQELTAMRAGGLTLWQIVSPVLMASLGLSLICLVILYQIAPESRYQRRTALKDAKEIDPVDLLEEGRFVRFPGLEIYVGRKEGVELEDVEVYELKGDTVVQMMRAKTGSIETDYEALIMQVAMQDVQIAHPDPADPHNWAKATVIPADSYEFPVEYDEMMSTKALNRNLKDMPYAMLVDCIYNVDTYKQFGRGQEHKREEMRAKAIVQAHKRVVMASTCFSFALLGIPLGITSRRKESSMGILISLGIVFAFYFMVTIGESLAKEPHLFPDLILWLPVIGSQVAGVILLRRADRL